MIIPLLGKNGKGKDLLISDCDYPLVKNYKWWVKIVGKINKHYYVKTAFTVNGKQIYPTIQQIILNPKKGQEIDHINGNGLDNRRENLRLCTRAENVRNTHKRKDSTTLYKGVSPRKNGYYARLQINGKRICSKVFKTQEEASKAYNLMAEKYFGKFARLNT